MTSTRQQRRDCDLSASWSSESTGMPMAASCSSSEEESHVARYRTFMQQQQQQQQKKLACQDERADEAREADDEEMEMMSCRFCTKNLACSRCAEARRRRKERDAAERTERAMSVSKPLVLKLASSSAPTVEKKTRQLPRLRPIAQPASVTNNTNTNGSGKLTDLLRTEAPLPDLLTLKPLTQPSTTAPQTTTGTTQKNAKGVAFARKSPELRPLTANEKAVSKTATTAPLKARTLPELVYYSSNSKTTNTNEAQKKPLATLDSTATPITYTSKALPELKPRSTATINLNAQHLDRLGAQFRSASKAQSAPMQALLLGQCFKPLACDVGAGAGEPLRNVKCHLRSCHPRYFALLEENGLMNEVADLHAADATECFIFIVPVPSVLDAQITEPHSEHTAHVLRYHVLRIPQGLTLARIRDRAVLPTLDEGREVEVEYREGDHYIGGHRVIPDEHFPQHIGHIRGLLDPDAAQAQVEEVELPPPMDAPQTPEEDASEPPSDMPPTLPQEEEEQGTQQLLYTQSRLGAVARDTLFTRAALKGVVDKLSMSYYKGATDLATQHQKLDNAQPVALTLRLYDTQQLWQRCQAQRLADISRLAPSQQLELRLNQTHQLVLGDGLCMSDYSAPEMKQMRLETMAQGLMELSFSSPQNAAQTTRLLCKLQTKKLKAAVGTYATDNENVLLRFANGVLENVLINHASAMPCGQESGREHFFELFLDERARQAFGALQPLDKLAFDTLLLKEGTLSKYTRKAKRYVTKKTRNVLGRAEAEKKRALAMKLMPVRSGGQMLDMMTGQSAANGQASGQLSARLYDRKMRVRDTDAVSGLTLQRFTEPVVWYQVQGDNQLYRALQRTENHYVELDVDQWRHLTFNANDVTSQAQLYYAKGAGDDVYVLAFEGQALRAVAKLSRKCKGEWCVRAQAPTQSQLGAVLACPHDCSSPPDENAKNESDLWKYIEYTYPKFYMLLRDNDLLSLMMGQGSLVFIVPDESALDLIPPTNRVSYETSALLEYHALIVRADRPLKSVTSLTEYSTMDWGENVQIERRGRFLYANGFKVQPDACEPLRILRISGMLRPDQIVQLRRRDLQRPNLAIGDNAGLLGATAATTNS